MSTFAPITLRVVDENGWEMFSATVPFEWELDVEQIMERAFVIHQTTSKPDPLIYTLQYYGYSQSPQFPGYLGYEVESIFGKVSDAKHFWQLLINGAVSQLGADAMQPGPGSTVLWQFTPVPDNPQNLAPRTRMIQERRVARSAPKR